MLSDTLSTLAPIAVQFLALLVSWIVIAALTWRTGRDLIGLPHQAPAERPLPESSRADDLGRPMRGGAGRAQERKRFLSTNQTFSFRSRSRREK